MCGIGEEKIGVMDYSKEFISEVWKNAKTTNRQKWGQEFWEQWKGRLRHGESGSQRDSEVGMSSQHAEVGTMVCMRGQDE